MKSHDTGHIVPMMLKDSPPPPDHHTTRFSHDIGLGRAGGLCIFLCVFRITISNSHDIGVRGMM